MASFSARRRVALPAALLLETAADVGSYPRFVPLVRSAERLADEGAAGAAGAGPGGERVERWRLGARLGPAPPAFWTSRVRIAPALGLVEALGEAGPGPLRSLSCRWRIHACGAAFDAAVESRVGGRQRAPAAPCGGALEARRGERVESPGAAGCEVRFEVSVEAGPPALARALEAALAPAAERAAAAFEAEARARGGRHRAPAVESTAAGGGAAFDAAVDSRVGPGRGA